MAGGDEGVVFEESKIAEESKEEQQKKDETEENENNNVDPKHVDEGMRKEVENQLEVIYKHLCA